MKTAKLKNKSARPLVLHDGTLLVPGEVTEVSEQTYKEMKEHRVGKDKEGPSTWEHLQNNHDVEEVEGPSERSTGKGAKEKPNGGITNDAGRAVGPRPGYSNLSPEEQLRVEGRLQTKDEEEKDEAAAKKDAAKPQTPHRR